MTAVLICWLPSKVLFSGLLYEVPVEDIVYSIETIEGFDRLMVSNSFSPVIPGFPELPALTYNYLLPRGQKLTHVNIVSAHWEAISGDFHLYPKQRDRMPSDEYEFTQPNQSVYWSVGPYPDKIVVATHTGSMRGYQIGQVLIVPFRYFPESGKLHVLTRIVIEIETEDCEPGLFPHRQTSLAQSVVDQVLLSMIVNTDALHAEGVRPPSHVVENPEDLQPSDAPSQLGAPVDLLIVTTDQQYEAYQNFARQKKLLGFNTDVKTLSWIRERYQGVDEAERVRNFIKDAVEQWGVLYVLIGGDVPEVPTRWFWIPPTFADPNEFHTVTDHYFSDLDGNWNFDGDNRFAELEDSLDLYPDVYIGRVPTRHSYEVSHYCNKVTSYLQPAHTDIQAKYAFFTSDLGDPGDSYDRAKRLAARLPAWFDTCFLDEKSLAELEDSIGAGFGLITGSGHGGINNIRVRTSPREAADVFFFDSLANTDRYAAMWLISCLVGMYQSNCLTKHWILSPHGGGIACIGPSYYSEAQAHESYTKRQFDTLFAVPLAASLARAKIFYLSQCHSHNWYRIYQFTLNLLGDPTLMLWDSIPLQYDSIAVYPDTIMVGEDTVTISVYPSIPFDVVFYKEGESFIRDSSSSGTRQSRVKTESAGYLKYTVMGDGYIAHIDSIVVEPDAPYCVYSDHTIIDSAGNNDGIINPGDDVWLHVVLENTGGSDATGVDAQLVCSDTFLTMLNDTSSYPDIVSDGIGENLTAFHFVGSAMMPDEHVYDLELVLNYSGETGLDSFQLIGAAPVLVHFAQVCSRVGDTIEIVPYVENRGHMIASNVRGRISAYSDTVVVADSAVVFPTIDTSATVNSAPDSFSLYITESTAAVRYNFRVYYQDSEVVNREVVVDTPAATDSIWALGMQHSIVLEWLPVPGAIGYRVYRASDYGGPYSFLRNYLEPVCRFEDLTVIYDSNYYYYVEVIDTSMNHSGPSDTVCGRMNPLLAAGWPQTVYDYCFSSPSCGDLDTTYPGNEIVVCGRTGNVYAWHYDGTPRIGDGRIFYFTPSLPYAHEIWSSPALGDVDADGSLEIVFCLRRDTENLYVIDGQGSILPGWPKTVGDGVIGSAALADIDEDGDLEIFVWSESADVYAFHHTGDGVYTPDGLLRDLPGQAYGTPAIGDINCDGDLEIVCCGGSESESLYVWDKDGNCLAPFPVYIQSSDSATGLKYSTVLGDIIGDGCLEIVFFTDLTNTIYVVDADGTIRWSQEIPHITHSVVAGVEGSPVVADITGDGRPEIMCGYLTGFIVFDSLGNILPGFPDTTHIARVPVVADVDGGNDLEVIVGSASRKLYGYKSSGQLAPGFPIDFGDRIESSPALYDIDEDGTLEMLVSSYDNKFYVYDLETEYAEWPKFRYDRYNTGTYKNFAPAAPYISEVTKSDSSVKLIWNTVRTNTLGNPKVVNYYVVYRNSIPSFVPNTSDSIGVVLHPETTFVDVGVLSSGGSHYYLIKAVDAAKNKSTKSNMAYAFRKTVNENAAATEKNRTVPESATAE